MTFPKISVIRKPLLEYLAKDQNFHSLEECVDHLVDHFDLTPEEREKRYEGNQNRKIFQKRVTYVISDFRIAQLIEDEIQPGKASFRITKTGLEVLNKGLDVITKKTLKQFGDYSLIDEDQVEEESKLEEESPEETLDDLSKKHAKQIQLDLLQQIKTRCSDKGFEKLCLKLLVTMGYGESQHTGNPRDRGVDGIISEDKLGLKQIYVQAKKHQSNVSYSEVVQFFGKCARDNVPGIFITTSDFSRQTIDEMNRNPVKLISGIKFAQYLYDYDLGVELAEKYELKQTNLEDLDEYFT